MPSISFSALRSSPALRRWLVPLLAAVTVMAGGVAVRAVGALARPELPARSAEQLLTGLQTARPDGLSGTVELRAELGLPALPGLGGGGSEFDSLLTGGSHTLKVWYSSPDSVRLALIGKLTESSIITNGSDLWTWSSQDNEVTHSKVPAREGERKRAAPELGASVTPEQVAAMVLAAIGPSTSVTTSATDRVAGRPVYELVLAPRDTDSLVAQVRIAIDAAEQVPLRVRVLAKGAANPAFEVGFSSVDFARPGAEWFNFTPPPGAKVTEKAAPSSPAAVLGLPALLTQAQGKGNGVTIGSGWTAVMVARVPFGANHSGRDDLSRLLRNLPRVDSGRVLSGSLFTALLTDDGRLLVGAVSAQRLQAVAKEPAAQLKPAG